MICLSSFCVAPYFFICCAACSRSCSQVGGIASWALSASGSRHSNNNIFGHQRPVGHKSGFLCVWLELGCDFQGLSEYSKLKLLARSAVRERDGRTSPAP